MRGTWGSLVIGIELEGGFGTFVVVEDVIGTVGLGAGEGFVVEAGGLAGLGVAQALDFAVEDEFGIVDEGHAVGGGKALRAFSDEIDVLALFEDEAGGLDGVAKALDAGYAAGFHAAAIHEQGVELDAAVGGEEGAAAGVEGGIVFKNGNGGLYGVDGGTASAEDGVSGFKGGSNSGLMGGSGVGWDGPCAPVDEEGGIVCGRGGHGDYGRAFDPSDEWCQGGRQARRV